jgi:hypothetical protein
VVDFWFPWQETLLNLLLRNYLHYNLSDQAEKLRLKAPRFEAHSNQQVTIIHQVVYFLSCMYAKLLQLNWNCNMLLLSVPRLVIDLMMNGL